jgi:hypothetical protein
LNTSHWIACIALSLLLMEGFLLSVFPGQVQAALQEIEPRALQWAGLAETVLAAALLTGLLLN